MIDEFPFPHSVIKKLHFTGTEEVRVKSERPGENKKEILVGLLENPVRTLVWLLKDLRLDLANIS